MSYLSSANDRTRNSENMRLRLFFTVGHFPHRTASPPLALQNVPPPPEGEGIVTVALFCGDIASSTVCLANCPPPPEGEGKSQWLYFAEIKNTADASLQAR